MFGVSMSACESRSPAPRASPPSWATVTGDTGQSDNVQWERDGEVYSFTGLTKEVLHELVGRDRDEALNGYKYWRHPEFDNRTLSDLRNSEAIGAGRSDEPTSSK